MSAWLCSDRHVATIANALITYKIVKDDPQWVSQQLYNENVKSLVARYGDEEKKNKRTVELTIPAPTNFAQLTMAVSSYRYQTCEHKGWKTSKVKKWTDQLLQQLAFELASRDTDGKSDNGWSL